MTADIHRLPASETFTVEQALQHARKAGLTKVLVIGYDDSGDSVVYSSRMTRQDALWLHESVRQWILGSGPIGGYEDEPEDEVS